MISRVGLAAVTAVLAGFASPKRGPAPVPTVPPPAPAAAGDAAECRYQPCDQST